MEGRLLIPGFALLSKDIIQEAENTGALVNSVKNVMTNHGMQENKFTIRNMSQMVGLLYCLIVVPRELWLNNEIHPLFREIDEDWLLSLVKIENKDSNFDSYPSYNLLRHLRNSISHVRFSIYRDEEFIFWNQRDDSSPEYFRAIIAMHNLDDFISKIGMIFSKHGYIQYKQEIEEFNITVRSILNKHVFDNQ